MLSHENSCFDPPQPPCFGHNHFRFRCILNLNGFDSEVSSSGVGTCGCRQQSATKRQLTLHVEMRRLDCRTAAAKTAIGCKRMRNASAPTSNQVANRDAGRQPAETSWSDDEGTTINKPVLVPPGSHYDSFASASHALQFFLDCPDMIWFHIIQFIAPPTHRARVICHFLAPLCRTMHQSMLLGGNRSNSKKRLREGEGPPSFSRHSLWNAILREDYGVLPMDDRRINDGLPRLSERRCSQRLHQHPLDRVRHAHRVLHDNTEVAFYYLTEMSRGKNGNRHDKKKNSAFLSRTNLARLMHEYGGDQGRLAVNSRVSSGGTFLVEVCRAVSVQERQILQCVQYLVEHHGALVNVSTYESSSSFLMPLCVVAVRGMPTVVEV
jgi:hypothetical protein